MIESSTYYIHVLTVEPDNIFIHLSSFIEKEKVFSEYCLLYEYAINHPPKNLIESIFFSVGRQLESVEHFRFLEVDKTVKQYMLYCGIDNVRGGTYFNEKLSDETVELLKHELDISKYNIQQSFLKEIDQQYLINDGEEIPSCAKIICGKKYNFTQLELKKEKHKKIKNELDYLKNIKIANTYLDVHILKHLRELYDYCFTERQDNWNLQITKNEKKDLIEHYKLSKIYLKDLYEKYHYLHPEKKTYPLFMKYPEFVFDDFFLHHNQSKIDEGEINRIQIWEIIELYYYTVKNCVVELAFDIEELAVLPAASSFMYQ